MRGVSLEEISAATRIAPRFLEALENEQWEQLPGGVFNRGFIRSTARYLGLNEDNLVAEYASIQGPPRPWRRRRSAGRARPLVGARICADGFGDFDHRRRLGRDSLPRTEDRRATAQTFRRSGIFGARASFFWCADQRGRTEFRSAAASERGFIRRHGFSKVCQLACHRSLSLAPTSAKPYVPATPARETGCLLGRQSA